MKLKPEKNSAPNGIRTHDLCDTVTVLYHLSCQANWELVIVTPCQGDYANDIRNIRYLNCGETYEDTIDHRSYAHNLSSCEILQLAARLSL